LPMGGEEETGFHFRRRGDALVLAMSDATPRWGFETEVDASVYDDRLARLGHRFPAAAGTEIADAWAGLYDMTPAAHPIVGRIADGAYAAGGRPRARRGDRARPLVVRPLALQPRALRRRARVPGDARSLATRPGPVPGHAASRRGYMRKTPNVVSAIGALSAAEMPSASTR